MPIDQGQYMHAMEEDVFTGKPMPKNAVQVVGSDVQLPVDIQSRYATTIQTHNAVSVGISTWSVQTLWMDCNGFDKIAVTLMNDAATAASINVYWSHDGSTIHHDELIVSNSDLRKGGATETKARYAKIAIRNTDAVAAHIMSAWAYLKA